MSKSVKISPEVSQYKFNGMVKLLVEDFGFNDDKIGNFINKNDEFLDDNGEVARHELWSENGKFVVRPINTFDYGTDYQGFEFAVDYHESKEPEVEGENICYFEFQPDVENIFVLEGELEKLTDFMDKELDVKLIKDESKALRKIMGLT